MRAIACQTFGGYQFEDIDDMHADRIATVVGAALWLRDVEAEAMKKAKRGKR